MEASKRILFLAEKVSGKVLADIGTDHCYLPIEAVKRGKVLRAVGIDVNEGPLLKGLENVKAYSLEGKIELRLGFGLFPLELGEADCAVISGMGGLLIKDIIEADKDKALAFDKLILSPQSDVPEIRRYCHAAGFVIADEWLVSDKNKFYNVLEIKAGEDSFYDESDYRYGKILFEKAEGEFINFAQAEAGKLRRIIQNIESASNNKDVFRLNEVKEDLYFYAGFCGRP